MKLPGEQLMIRLWETLSERGIGSLLKPWQIKREGLAHLEIRRAELLSLAQTEKDAEEIRTGQRSLEDYSPKLTFATSGRMPSHATTRTAPPIDLPLVVETAARQTIEDSVRRQVNVAHAIAHAEERLKDDPQEPPSKKVHDDWLYRWRDYAGDVSAEDMQILWGRILAGEIKSPGSLSLRTLDFLRNLSQEEAEAISRISRYAISDFIWRDDSLKNELPFSTMREMQDLGVLSGAEAIGLQTKWTSDDPAKFVKALTSHSKVLVVTHDDPTRVLSITAYKITSIGRQLLRLGTFAPHIEYLSRVGRSIQTQGFGVALADFVQESEVRIRIFNKHDLATPNDVQPGGPTAANTAG